MLTSKNKWKMGKKALCLVFALIFSIESFAAVVSDNDGSAFVTKAEFEALKKDFAEQIDNYNTSIDSKIDGAIANYLAGINIDKPEEQISLINKLDSLHFSRNFNYFGNGSWSGTSLSGQYRCWGYYGGTWGIDRASVGTYPDHIMVGIRGSSGNSVIWIQEKTVGDLQDRYIVCNPSSFDTNLPKPAYGVSSYNYYSMMWLSSNYGVSVSKYFAPEFSQTVSGVLSGTSFGVEFQTINNPHIPTDAPIGASILYSCTPVDTPWPSGYDSNALCGTAMSESDDCYYILATDLMVHGDADGTINPIDSRENASWANRAGRSYWSTTTGGVMDLQITKYKRKYKTIKWKDFIIDAVSNIVNKKSYYYSGLPLFTASKNGVVTMKITPTNTESEETVIAISDKQFTNQDIGTGGIGSIDNAGCTFTDWTMESGTEYEIKWNVKKDTTYWIKACPVNTSNRTTFNTSSITITED